MELLAADLAHAHLQELVRREVASQLRQLGLVGRPQPSGGAATARFHAHAPTCRPGGFQRMTLEEVTLRGGYGRRPDLVLYLNGVAMGVIELKRSSVEVADGVRQLITNQEEIFNKGLFSTVQLVFAGSDSQGLGRFAAHSSFQSATIPHGDPDRDIDPYSFL
jgi:hypothetical protein